MTTLWGYSISETRSIDYDKNDKTFALYLAEKVKRGENQEALNNLSKCMLCGKCLLVCPRGVDTRKMILTLIQYLRK